MAVLTSVVDVNNGNSGWSIPQVIDGLETTFENLGWHSGTALSGVPCYALPPSETIGSAFNFYGGEAGEVNGDANWRKAGGPTPTVYNGVNRQFDVISNGSTSYYMCERWTPSNIELATDTITIRWNRSDPNPNHSTNDIVQTGNKLRWAPGGTDANLNIGGLTLDTDYYAIRVSETEIKLALSEADAQAGTAISLTSIPPSWTYYLRRPQDSTTENRQIDVYVGDHLYFMVDSSDFFLWDSTVGADYHDDRVLNDTNCSAHSYRDYPVGMGSGSCNWETDGWEQSEDEVWDPTKLDGVGYTGLQSYSYGHKTNTNMKGIINLLPRYSNHYTSFKPYWKYTVPASGSRSELKMRFYREVINYGYSGHLVGCSIHSIGSGWSDDEVFVVPGEMIGGDATVNDVPFGVNVDETSSNSYDGTCSILTTEIGSGTSFYQKHTSTYNSGYSYAVLRLENDASKKFGTTYWTFGFHNDSYRMFLKSGIGWSILNRKGIKYTGSDGTQLGHFQGDKGLDYQGAHGEITYETQDDYISYAHSNTPNAWPLSIRTYKAQAPQDDNFAILQFTQLVNGNNICRGNIIFHHGDKYSPETLDLDHSWLGSYTQIYWSTSEPYVQLEWKFPGYNYSWNNPSFEPLAAHSVAREFSYGWMRNKSSSDPDLYTRWTANINYESTAGDPEFVVYYRDSNHDKYWQSYDETHNERYMNRKEKRLTGTPPAMDYYKPIKGLPLQQRFAPCPYYIPDDFVLIQAAVQPASTVFYPGDTVEISASEKYMVVVGGYEDYATGLDNVASGTSIAMLLCARIP